MRVGYYVEAPFYWGSASAQIPVDIARWAGELATHFEEFRLFMHRGQGGFEYVPPPRHIKMIDLGQQPPHWMRGLGWGFPRERVRGACSQLDAVLIQVPTSGAAAFSQLVAPALEVFLNVGIWTALSPLQFQSHSRLRRAAIDALVLHTHQRLREATRDKLVLTNNSLACGLYRHARECQLVSKGLVSESEIAPRASQAMQHPTRVVYYGRVDPEKHLETVLHAAKRLGSDFVFEIAGQGNEAYLAHLKSLAAQLNVSSRVSFTGRVLFEDRYKVLRNADIGVFHTLTTEGFPRVLWEAFAVGLPMVCARYPGAEGLLADGEHVVFFERTDDRQLAEALQRMRDDERLRAALRKHATALVKEHSLERATRHIANLIKNAHVRRHVARGEKAA